jgi:hypothetical protein
MPICGTCAFQILAKVAFVAHVEMIGKRHQRSSPHIAIPEKISLRCLA